MGLRPVLWIRIRIDLHSIFCPGFGSVSGMRIRIQEHGNCHKFTNKPGFLPFKKVFVSSCVCFLTYCPLKYIFHVKIELFVTLKSDHDPDPDPFLAPWTRIRIHIEIKSWIQIRIQTNADPQNCLRLRHSSLVFLQD